MFMMFNIVQPLLNLNLYFTWDDLSPTTHIWGSGVDTTTQVKVQLGSYSPPIITPNWTCCGWGT